MVKVRILLPLFLCFTLSSAHSIQLQDLEWQSRPLLIFAPDQSDQNWLETRKLLNQHRCELDDRNIVLGKIYTHGESTLSGQLISNEYVDALQRQFQIASQDFMVILLGKDGQEKYRSNVIPELQELFQLIDQMPMRRIELKQQSSPCNQVDSK